MTSSESYTGAFSIQTSTALTESGSPSTGVFSDSISLTFPFSDTLNPTASDPAFTSSGSVDPSLVTSSISSPVPLSTPLSSTSSSVIPSQVVSREDYAFNTAALIGIIVGGTTFLLIIMIGALCYLQRGRRKYPKSDDDHIHLSSTTTRGPSYEPNTFSTGQGPVYAAIPTTNREYPPIPMIQYSDNEPPSPSLSPNWKHHESPTLEGTVEEIGDKALVDPFSSGYLPPPSPTPSEYVIVENTSEEAKTSQASHEKNTLDLSLFNTGEAATKSPKGSPSKQAHTRLESGDRLVVFPPSANSSAGSSPKRQPNKLHRPRRSDESNRPRRSNESVRSPTSPTSPHLRNLSGSPTKTPPTEPFRTLPEEDDDSLLRTSFENPQKHPFAIALEAQSLERKRSRSHSRPSLDSVTAAPGASSPSPRQKGHVKLPSSPPRLKPSTSSFWRGPAASMTSLPQTGEQTGIEASHIRARSPTMTDANAYDFDIYRQPPSGPSDNKQPAEEGEPTYGSAGSRKRFSTSMTELRRPTASPFSSTSQLPSSTQRPWEGDPPKQGLMPTTNLYIPKESLDLDRK